MPLGAPSGVPWGMNLSGHPSALSAIFYCFVCILMAWEGGSWVSLLSQAWFLLLYLSGAKDLNLYLELNSEMLTAFQNPRLSEHRMLSFTPRKRPAGKGGKLVPLAIGTQWNPQALGSDILACSASSPLVPG